MMDLVFACEEEACTPYAFHFCNQEVTKNGRVKGMSGLEEPMGRPGLKWYLI